MSSIVPSAFVCPITTKIMINPVITCLGYTYEKKAIEKWFSHGRLKEPLTGEQLPNAGLISNHNLRSQIQAYMCDQKKSRSHVTTEPTVQVTTVSEQKRRNNLLIHNSSFVKLQATFERLKLGFNSAEQQLKAMWRDHDRPQHTSSSNIEFDLRQARIQVAYLSSERQRLLRLADAQEKLAIMS